MNPEDVDYSFENYICKDKRGPRWQKMQIQDRVWVSECVCVCVWVREREIENKDGRPFYICILNLVLLRGDDNQHKSYLEIFGKNWHFIGEGVTPHFKKGESR